MNFWNHVYSMTIGAFSYLFQPIPPSYSGATSPLFSGLQTTFLPGFMICAILLPGPFLTRNVVPNRTDFLACLLGVIPTGSNAKVFPELDHDSLVSW